MAKVALTPRLVESLKVEAGRARTVYIDTHRDAPKGFALRVSDNGGRAYYFLATLKSRGRVWVRLGDARSIGLEAARKAARARAGEIAMGRDPNVEARAARARDRTARLEAAAAAGEWTVTDLLRAYVAARLESLSPVTAGSYERMIVHDVEPSDLGSLLARDVLKDDVRRLITRLGKRAPAIAAHALALIRAASRWALDEETLVTLPDGRRVARPRIERDPTRRIEDEQPKVKAASRRQRERHLSDAEIVTFWKGLDALKPAWSTFARVILLCGTRRGETYRARWRDLDFEAAASTWTIPAKHRKGRVEGSRGARRGLVVPLPALAVDLLKALRHVTAEAQGAPPRWREWCFRAQGFSIGLIGDEVKRVTGLADVSIHDLRRSTASGLQRIGAPPHIISTVLGHAREAGATATDAAYTHDRRVDEHRLWLERWARHVGSLVSRESRASVTAIRP